MMTLWHDLRFAIRMLAKRPGFTAIVTLALALGMGVNTAVLSAMNVFLIRPLPVPAPAELVTISLGAKEAASLSVRASSFADYEVIAAEDQLFKGVLSTTTENLALSSGETKRERGTEQAELIQVEMVSGNYFDVLGVRPLLGRTFSPDEGRPVGAAAVTVLSHELWQRRFHGDREVLGRKLYLNGNFMTVIGVMPPAFKGPASFLTGVNLWLPVGLRGKLATGNEDWRIDRGQRTMLLIGRLRPGVTQDQARARLQVLAQTLAAQYPATNAGTEPLVTSEIEGRYGAAYGTVKLGFTMALLVAFLVLLISCANVANLLLARTAARTKELGVRLALGAGRARLFRQLLTESLLLALLGGGLGVILAFWVADLLLALLPTLPGFPRLELEPDRATILWSLAVSVLAGVLFGAVPAWRASRADVVAALKTDVGAEGQGTRRAGLRQALVIAQVAVSVVVVASGGLVLRSLHKMEGIDPGFRPDTLVSAIIDPGMLDDYFKESDTRQFFVELARRMEQQPGVRSVASSRWMPLVNLSSLQGPVVKEGDPPPPPNEGMKTGYSLTYGRYFETMGTELVVGRDFIDADHEGTPRTVIINQEIARQLYGGEQAALGRRLRIGGPEAPLLEVIGVARTGRYRQLDEAPGPYLYVPGDLPDFHETFMTHRSVMVRAASVRDAAAIAAVLRTEIQRLDARIPVPILLVGDSHLGPALFNVRLLAELGMVLGLLALGLATMGIYSLMTYTVTQRTKEIGIRMALGGQVVDVLRLVLGQGLRLILIGVVLGALGAAGVARLIGGLLYGVGALDPVALLAAIGLFVAVGLLATLLPARRATKVDPMVALRYE
jgi:predicted permease